MPILAVVLGISKYKILHAGIVTSFAISGIQFGSYVGGIVGGFVGLILLGFTIAKFNRDRDREDEADRVARFNAGRDSRDIEIKELLREIRMWQKSSDRWQNAWINDHRLGSIPPDPVLPKDDEDDNAG